MKKLFVCSALTACSIVLSFCKKSTTATAPTCDISYTYNSGIKSIIDVSCTSGGCHGAGSGNGVFTSYTGLKTVLANGKFKNEVVTKKTMPESGSLSAADLNSIQCWLTAGYPEN